MTVGGKNVRSQRMKDIGLLYPAKTEQENDSSVKI